MPQPAVTRRSLLGIGMGVLAAPFLASAARASTAPPIRVGVLLDTGGTYAGIGARQLLGAEYQARAGSTELIVADTSGDASLAASAAERLLADGVHALVGGSTPWTAAVIAAAGERARVPVVLTGNGWTPRDSFVFRVGVPLPMSFDAAMRAASGLRVARIQQDRLHSTRGDRLLEQAAADNGVTLADRVFAPSDGGDLRPVVAEVLRCAPDVVHISALPPFDGTAVRAIGELGWRGKVHCGPDTGTPGFFAEAGEAAEGVRVAAPWSAAWDLAPTATRSRLRTFADGFEQAHGPLDTHAAFGADAVAMAQAAFAGHDDRIAARERLAALTHAGLTGLYAMTNEDHGGLAEGSLTMLTARDGRWRV